MYVCQVYLAPPVCVCLVVVVILLYFYNIFFVFFGIDDVHGEIFFVP